MRNDNATRFFLTRQCVLAGVEQAFEVVLSSLALNAGKAIDDVEHFRELHRNGCKSTYRIEMRNAHVSETVIFIWEKDPQDVAAMIEGNADPTSL